MADQPTDPMRTAPLAGSRSQSVQRLQIGLVGLASMILLVGLANIILTNAQENQSRVVPEAAPTVASEQEAASETDPLVDAGVVPAMPEETEAESGDADASLQP